MSKVPSRAPTTAPARPTYATPNPARPSIATPTTTGAISIYRPPVVDIHPTPIKNPSPTPTNAVSTPQRAPTAPTSTTQPYPGYRRKPSGGRSSGGSFDRSWNRPTPQPQPKPTTPRTPRVPSGIGAGSRIPGGLAVEIGIAQADQGRRNVAGLDSPEGRDFYREKFPQLPAFPSQAGNDPVFGSPYNPLNPFGKWWDWAPWNQGKSPNSLNPPPATESPGFDADGFWPISDPPAFPIWFRASVNVSIYNYFDSFGQNQTGATSFATYGGTRTWGRPLGARKQTLPASPPGSPALTRHSFQYINEQGNIVAAWSIDILSEKTRGFNSLITTILSTPYNPEGHGSRLEPQRAPADLDNLEPLPMLDPFAPQQFEPTNRPEFPIPTIPNPWPGPLGDQLPRPSPRPGRRPVQQPSPKRDPGTQPNPFPAPTVDPTAPPGPQTDPGQSPFPSFQPSPNPGPQPKPSFNPSGSPNSSTNKAPGADTDKLKVPDVLIDVFPQIQINIDRPAPEFDLCKDPCIADMHDSSKAQKPVSIDYQIFIECSIETGAPVFQTQSIEVPANQAEFMQTMLNNFAVLQGEKCTVNPQPECYAAIPDSHEIRLAGIPPQLVVQYAEELPNGKFGAPKYSISIPYYRYSEAETTPNRFPVYTKGQRFGVLVLPDNAKVIVNAVSEAETNRVLKQLELLILPNKRERVITSNNVRRGQDLKKIKVVPRIAKYFVGNALVDGNNNLTESKNAKPAWIKYF